ncbi:DUF402 domain-containing protein [Streptomyces sp. NPDC096068]|uniref:DUF402 domain-containing protein n=1 Tax=Streptomyces sp. NPDC096068 TaxID=3155424 RepID=UPI00331CC0DA
MRAFEAGATVVRRDVHRTGRVWSEQALRVLADTDEALVTACAPGAEARWPALYARARDEGDRSVRAEAFEALATGEWELADAVWQETDLLLWKPPTAWFSINAFFVPDNEGERRLRNWYVNFEHPTRRHRIGFDTEHRAVNDARAQVMAMLAERTGVFAQAERWAAWAWKPTWPTPRLPRPTAATEGFVPS